MCIFHGRPLSLWPAAVRELDLSARLMEFYRFPNSALLVLLRNDAIWGLKLRHE
jgi:hypothetical protein